MKSIWNDNVEKPKFNQLNGDIKTDVLIIGGGLCGILCAYMLKNAGIDYILAETDEICGGVTNATTAKITVQHGLIYDKIIKPLYLYYSTKLFDSLFIFEKIAKKLKERTKIIGFVRI